MSTEFAVQYFPGEFTPAANDIVVGRQKMASKHPGNIRLNEIIDSHLEEYRLSAEDKNRKSQILAEIYNKIQNENGRFVKLDCRQRKWYEVAKSVARERISQGFRDSLKDYYKSSLAYKKKRRLVKNGYLQEDDPTLQIASPVAVSNTSSAKHAKKGENERDKTMDKDGQIENDGAIEIEGGQNSAATTGKSGTDKSQHLALDSQGDKKEDPSAPFLPRDGIQLMDEGFEPLKNDIVVGLRKRSAEHHGNQYLTEVVKTFLEEYKNAGRNKSLKSQVLGKVASALSTLDPPARFVRLEQKHQRWYEIEAFYTREKISQTFRDIAQDGYRSANSFKNLKRRRTKSSSRSEELGESSKDGEGHAHAGEAHPKETDASSNKRLPPKKAAARKAAAATPEPTNEVPIDISANQGAEVPSGLSRREQLALQIEQLKKEMELLEQEDKRLKEANSSHSNEVPASKEPSGTKEETEKVGRVETV